jgi:hypothetical protein
MSANFLKIDLGRNQEGLFSHQYYTGRAYTTYPLGCAALTQPLLEIKTVLEFYPGSFAARTNIAVTDEIFKLPELVQSSFIRHPKSLEDKYCLMVNRHCTKVLGHDGCAKFEMKSGRWEGQTGSFVLSVYFGHTSDKSAFHDMKRHIPPRRPLTTPIEFYHDLHCYATLLEDTVNGIYQDLSNFDIDLEAFESCTMQQLMQSSSAILRWNYEQARVEKPH